MAPSRLVTLSVSVRSVEVAHHDVAMSLAPLVRQRDYERFLNACCNPGASSRLLIAVECVIFVLAPIDPAQLVGRDNREGRPPRLARLGVGVEARLPVVALEGGSALARGLDDAANDGLTWQHTRDMGVLS